MSSDPERMDRLRVMILRTAVAQVLEDEETGTVWGPDVTMAYVLKEALARTEPADQDAELERQLRQRIAAQVRQIGPRHYPTDVFIPGGESTDARSADFARTLIRTIAEGIENPDDDGT